MKIKVVGEVLLLAGTVTCSACPQWPWSDTEPEFKGCGLLTLWLLHICSGAVMCRDSFIDFGAI